MTPPITAEIANSIPPFGTADLLARFGIPTTSTNADVMAALGIDPYALQDQTEHFFNLLIDAREPGDAVGVILNALATGVLIGMEAKPR